MAKTTTINGIQSSSPQALAIAANSLSHPGADGTNTSVVTGLLIAVEPPEGKFVAELRMSAPFGAGESLSISMDQQRPDGTSSVLIALITVDSSSVINEGVVDLVVANVAVGDSIGVAMTYTAGGTPAAPITSLILQAI